MAKAVIIGGGIVGLSSAYYLLQSGWEVTVLDKGDFSNNCSYGNAGYVCPSHFIPLATPGIVKQGLKWMLNPESPFYVKPRLDMALINWGLKFIRSANAQHVQKSAVPLRDIAILSKRLYEEWLSLPGFDFAYQHRGLIELFQTAEKEKHAHHTLADAKALGLAARMLDADEVQQMEPRVRMDIKGALFFECDAHLYPNLVMKEMRAYLQNSGVQFISGQEVDGFVTEHGKVKQVLAGMKAFDADVVVLAAGSWSRGVAKQLNVKLPLVGGRGYSVTLDHSAISLNHPAVLMEGRVALTPFSPDKIRIGGTMEITSLDAPPRMNRVKGIINAVKRYYPDAEIPMPTMDQVWYGYRPCSADGMPYIGRTKKFSNCVIATGHAMVGMSLGAATGKLVSEVLNEQPASVDLSPYDPHRFD